MATTTASDFSLNSPVVRDVCARPAILARLAAAVPSGVGGGDRAAQAVADGIARVLAITERDSGSISGRDRDLLHAADRRMWDPLDPGTARALAGGGPDALFALFVLEEAVRREAWRVDTARRRGRDRQRLPLEEAIGRDDERERLDLERFRLEVEVVAERTAERAGIEREEALALILGEARYVEVAERHGRSPNALWMALARTRDDWRSLAERGRAAGLGGGLGLDLDLLGRTDRVVRRAIRWRLIGGVTAALLLAALTGAALAATLLGGAAPPRAATPPPEEAATPTDEGVGTQIGRLVTLELGRRLGAGALPPRRVAPVSRSRAASAGRVTPSQAPSAPTPKPSAAPASTPSVPSAPPPSSIGCGFGSAALVC